MQRLAAFSIALAIAFLTDYVVDTVIEVVFNTAEESVDTARLGEQVHLSYLGARDELADLCGYRIDKAESEACRAGLTFLDSTVDYAELEPGYCTGATARLTDFAKLAALAPEELGDPMKRWIDASGRPHLDHLCSAEANLTNG